MSAAVAVKRVRELSSAIPPTSTVLSGNAPWFDHAYASLKPDPTAIAPRRGREVAAENELLHRCCERQADRQPYEIAVMWGDQKITYAALNERSNRLARYLSRLLASTAGLVGVFMEPRIETIICLLAVLKAGRAYIPLDPDAPPRQTGAILAETEALVLLPSESLAASLPARRTRAIDVKSEREAIECGNPGNLSNTRAGEDPACVAFQPVGARFKAVEIRHSACLKTIESLKVCLTAADRFVATIHPDPALVGLSMFAPLICGARLILATAEEQQNGALLLEQIERSRGTVLQATPRIARAVCDAGWNGRPKLKFLCSTEPWPEELMKTLNSLGAELWRIRTSAENDYACGNRRIDG